MTTKLKNSWLLPSLAALVLWGFWAFLPKLAMQSMSPQSVIFYESIGSLLVAGPIFLFLKGNLVRDKKGIMIAACSNLVSIVAILAYYYALRLGPVATIVTLTALYPVVGLALAWVILKERINCLQLAAVVMALAAVVLLAG